MTDTARPQVECAQLLQAYDAFILVVLQICVVEDVCADVDGTYSELVGECVLTFLHVTYYI